jgi:hypothetical protein
MLPIIILIVAVTFWLATVAIVMAICASAARDDRRLAGTSDQQRGQSLRLVA